MSTEKENIDSALNNALENVLKSEKESKPENKETENHLYTYLNLKGIDKQIYLFGTLTIVSSSLLLFLFSRK